MFSSNLGFSFFAERLRNKFLPSLPTFNGNELKGDELKGRHGFNQ